MHNIFNIFLYISIVSFVLLGWFFVAIPLLIWFSFNSSVAWFLPTAILIDGYFGAFESLPLLTIVTIVWFVFSELLRPRLVWHNEI